MTKPAPVLPGDHGMPRDGHGAMLWSMMGTVLLLLLFPDTVWALGELLARYGRAPFVWALFGFSVARGPRATGHGRLRRAPMLPRRAPHERGGPLPFHEPLPETDHVLLA